MRQCWGRSSVVGGSRVRRWRWWLWWLQVECWLSERVASWCDSECRPVSYVPRPALIVADEAARRPGDQAARRLTRLTYRTLPCNDAVCY